MVRISDPGRLGYAGRSRRPLLQLAESVQISYNNAHYLQTRDTLSKDLMQNLAVIEILAAKAAE